MKGIFLKNWIVLLGGLKFNLILLTVAGLIMAIAGGMNVFGVVFASMFLCSIVMSLLEYNERSKWELYSDVLPIGRKGTVQGMYLFSLSYFAAFAVLALIVTTPFAVLMPEEFDLVGFMLTPIISLVVPMMVCALSFPFLFKFGYKVFRVIFVVVLGALGGAGGFFFGYFMVYDESKELAVVGMNLLTVVPWAIAALGGALILYFLSMLLSSKLYRTVEL